MTPGARIAAAIAVLDRVVEGQAAEQALTGWARGARYAGSKDRAAVRDHVFSVLRRWRSCAVRGGGTGGRALMLGALRLDGRAPEEMFTGEGHAPAPLGAQEVGAGAEPAGADALDLPDWVLERLECDLGTDTAHAVALRLRERAPLFLRVNLRKSTREAAIAELEAAGIVARPGPLSPTALEVVEGGRRLRLAPAYLEGRVEIQDAASQAVCDSVPVSDGQSVLDYCAGGGGKSLALAARARLAITAHDAVEARMKDLPARAARAGVRIETVAAGALKAIGGYDIVVADVPCSGSGAWRRQPEAKWRLTPARLTELTALQGRILDECAQLLRPGGQIAYMTCSLLQAENTAPVQAFLAAHPGFELLESRSFSPLEGGDGLFVARIAR